MRINLFVTTYNNENIISQFINFYKLRVPNIIINIFDQDSTDRTKEIAEKEGSLVKQYNNIYINKNDWKNNCWKNVPTDCVIICNINEFIDITLDLFNNCSLIQTKGYDISNLKEVNERNRNEQYDKYCIFDTAIIKEMNYDGSQCNPVGFIQVGEKKPNLYHLTKLK